MAVRSSYRWYISLDTYKSWAETPDTADDEIIKALISGASKTIERSTHRRFIPVTATKTFDFDEGYVLRLDDDLIYLTSLSYDDTSISTGDVFKYPTGEDWCRRIEIDRSTSSFFSWINSPQQCISVGGRWAYCEDYEATGATVNEALSSSDTTMTVSNGALIEVGWCCLIGAEQVFVTAVSNNDVTVRRGVNGTTAATHASGDAIYRYVPPDDIERACFVIAKRWSMRGESSWADRTGTPEAGYTIYGEMPLEVKAILSAYTWHGQW